MTPYQIQRACIEYVDTRDPVRRADIARRIAGALKADPDEVEAVLKRHRSAVEELYDNTHNRPSMASLEREDEIVSDALAGLTTRERIAA